MRSSYQLGGRFSKRLCGHGRDSGDLGGLGRFRRDRRAWGGRWALAGRQCDAQIPHFLLQEFYALFRPIDEFQELGFQEVNTLDEFLPVLVLLFGKAPGAMRAHQCYDRCDQDIANEDESKQDAEDFHGCDSP
jgi:hypothetical protein